MMVLRFLSRNPYFALKFHINVYYIFRYTLKHLKCKSRSRISVDQLQKFINKEFLFPTVVAHVNLK